MKNLFLLLLLTLGVVASWGQTRLVGPTIGERAFLALPHPDAEFRQQTDTLAPGAFQDTCSQQAFGYTVADTWGTVAGNNGYGDLAKAQLLELNLRPGDTLNTSALVQEVWVFFNFADTVANGSWNVDLYAIDPETGGPGERLGSSDSLQVSDILIDSLEVVPTIVRFDPPVRVDSAFFASVNFGALYESEDTISILQTRDDCGDGADSWELLADGETWLPIDESWGLESNFFIFAVIDTGNVTSISFPKVTGLRVHPIFPNPSHDEIRLVYELDQSSRVLFELYSSSGTLVRQINRGQAPAGSHMERVHTQDLPPGIYFYTLTTNEGKVTGRMVHSP